MSIRELTCPAHGHPVGPDDTYCGVCGVPVSVSPAAARQTWPALVPDPEPITATITPIRPPVEFKPLDFVADQSTSRRRGAGFALAVLATIACAVSLVVSELRLQGDNDGTFWTVMWLTWYAATVVAVAGWLFGLIQWARHRTWHAAS